MTVHYIKKYIQQKESQLRKIPGESNTTYELFYRNQMSKSYKIDEKILKTIIIKQNTKCIDENDKLKLNIYYKNKTISNLLMKNSPKTEKLHRTSVLYQYECKVEDCEPQTYIGYTRTTL